MEPEKLLWEWLIWHRAVEYVKEDLRRLEAMKTTLRLPYMTDAIIRYVGSQAYAREQKAAAEMRAGGVRIIKKKVDRNEILVAWSHRGNTDILRIQEREIRREVQQRIDGLASNTPKPPTIR